jgi:hypothetical protein
MTDIAVQVPACALWVVSPCVIGIFSFFARHILACE